MAGKSGTKKLQSFAPNWGDPQVLERTLVGRRQLVDRLEELAIDGARGGPLHQRLIVGPRGSGKTHVVRVLHNRLQANEELKSNLILIYLLEDELGVASFLDFVVRMLRAFARWHPNRAQLAQSLEELYDLPLGAQEHRAVHLLLEEVADRRAVVLMENLGVTFDKKAGFGRAGQQALRDFLQQNPRFMIFATSQALVEGTRDRDAPFHGFFHVTHLRRLTREQAMELLVAIADASGKPDVVAFLMSPEGRGRTSAIYDFTGGNHRLLVTFYDFLSAASVARLSEIFMDGLNPLRPYYQEQMRGLSAQQQKIVQYLSVNRGAQTVKQIARGCLVAGNVLSSQLKDLLARNIVSRHGRGRESFYELTEELFRIVYQADLEQEGAPVRLFIDFLGNFYTGDELCRKHRGYALLGQKLGNSLATPFLEEATLYAEAIHQYHPDMSTSVETAGVDGYGGRGLQEFLGELRQAGAYRDIVEFAQYLEGERDAFVLHTEAYAHAQLGDHEQALARAEEALRRDRDDVDAHLVIAEVLSSRSDARERGVKHALRAVALSPEDADALEKAGIIFGNAGQHAKALECFETVKRLRPDYSRGWRLAGRALERLDRLEEAEQHYRKAIQLDEDSATARESLGVLLFNGGHYAAALAEFEATKRLRPEYSEGCWLAGRALARLDRLEEAEQHYRRAIQLDEDNADAHESLGMLLGNGGQYAGALAEFEATKRLRPEYSEGWRRAGLAQEKLGGLDEAEQHYRKAIELDKDNADAHENLGVLLGSGGQHAEALTEFEAMKRLWPEYSDGWRFAGVALRNLDRLEEAEQHCRKAIQLDESNADAHENLGVLLGSGGRHAEALAEFESVTRLRSEYAKGWRLAGLALVELGRLAEAEQHYRKAIELHEDDVNAHESLGLLLHNGGRHAEALAEFESVTGLRPDDARGWWLVGLMLEELGRLEEAEQHYRKAIELDEDNTDAHEHLGVLLLNGGRHAEALAEFESVTRLRPDFARGWWLAGRALEDLGRLEEAERHCRKAIELDEDNTDAHKSLGVLLFNSRQHAEALAEFEAVTRLRPDYSEGWRLAGRALKELGRSEEAEHHYRKAIEFDDGNADAHEPLGLLLGSGGQHAEALAEFEAVKRLRPDYSDGWGLVGSALAMLGRLKEAEQHYRKAIELDRQNALPWRGLASVLVSLGKEPEAQRAVESALALGAPPAYVHNSCGEARRLRGDYEGALRDYEAALAADPAAVWPRFNIISSRLGMGNVEAAAATVEDAISAARKAKGDVGIVVQSIDENLQALFEHAPEQGWGTFLAGYLYSVREAEFLPQLEQALPLAIFALLRAHARMPKERLSKIADCLQSSVGRLTDVTVAVRFLRTGIEHFEEEDPRALLRLPKEERRLFMRELGIEDEGDR